MNINDLVIRQHLWQQIQHAIESDRFIPLPDLIQFPANAHPEVVRLIRHFHACEEMGIGLEDWEHQFIWNLFDKLLVNSGSHLTVSELANVTAINRKIALCTRSDTA